MRDDDDDDGAAGLTLLLERVARLCRSVDSAGSVDSDLSLLTQDVLSAQSTFAYARFYWSKKPMLTFEVPGDMRRHLTQLSMRYAAVLSRAAGPPLGVRVGAHALRFATNDLLHRFMCELTSPEWQRVSSRHCAAGGRDGCDGWFAPITDAERRVRVEVMR